MYVPERESKNENKRIYKDARETKKKKRIEVHKIDVGNKEDIVMREYESVREKRTIQILKRFQASSPLNAFVTLLPPVLLL